MPEYRRAFQPGGMFFFTLVTYRRRPILTDDSARRALHQAIDDVRKSHPFSLDAIVLLPDHLHCLWTLPENDAKFSLRWQLIKSSFSRYCRYDGGVSAPISSSRHQKQEQGYWQRRFWEHMVRNEREYEILCNYIHYNPVKHGHAKCPHLWPFSSFHKYVQENRYDKNWGCECVENPKQIIFPSDYENIVGE
jgi:putative transposase